MFVPAFAETNTAEKAQTLPSIKALPVLGEKIVAQLDILYQQLLQIAQDPNVQEWLVAEDTAKLQNYIETRTPLIPDALKLRLFSRETKLVSDIQGSPPLGYASILLIKRALEGEIERGSKSLQIYVPGTDQEHLAMLQTVYHPDGNIIGVAHLSASTEVIKRLLQTYTGDGYLELHRGEDKVSVPLTYGEKPETHELANATESVAIYNWRLYRWKPALLSTEATDITKFSVKLIFTLLLGIAALLLILYANKRRDKITHLVEQYKEQGYEKALAVFPKIKDIKGINQIFGERSSPKEETYTVQYEGAIRDIMEGKVMWANRYFPQFDHTIPPVTVGHQSGQESAPGRYQSFRC